MVKEDLVRYHSLHSERVEVIYHGVDLERFHPSCQERFRAAVREKLGIMQGSVLLFVAHNFRLKGLGTLLGVLGRLRDPEPRWNLVVVGRGKSRPFERLAAAMDIQDRVLFVGAQDAPEAFYGASDLLVHPTFYDPFGLVCLEAMACGVPVITTRFAGAHELIETGEEGWVVDDPEDDLALEDALRSLMTRVDLQVMGQKARRKAEHFSWDEHVGRLLAVYERARSYRGGLR
jgi:UDP-glucose:(heptosyl)LPS alpha-1,3-glucosyltransferase